MPLNLKEFSLQSFEEITNLQNRIKISPGLKLENFE